VWERQTKSLPLSGFPISGCQKFSQMYDPGFALRTEQAIGQVQHAARASRRHNVGSRLHQGTNLAEAHLVGQGLVAQAESPTEAATLIRVSHFKKGYPGDILQEPAGLLPDSLGLAQVAGIMVGDTALQRSTWGPERDLIREKLRKVIDPNGQVGLVILLERGAAACTGGYDGVAAGSPQDLEVALLHSVESLPIACSQRWQATADLIPGNCRLDPVLPEHLEHRPSHLRVRVADHASGKERHLPFGTGHLLRLGEGDAERPRAEVWYQALSHKGQAKPRQAVCTIGCETSEQTLQTGNEGEENPKLPGVGKEPANQYLLPEPDAAEIGEPLPGSQDDAFHVDPARAFQKAGAAQGALFDLFGEQIVWLDPSL